MWREWVLLGDFRFINCRASMAKRFGNTRDGVFPTLTVTTLENCRLKGDRVMSGLCAYAIA
jgi:hypothetical protein